MVVCSIQVNLMTLYTFLTFYIKQAHILSTNSQAFADYIKSRNTLREGGEEKVQ